jgi:hypothetical protein
MMSVWTRRTLAAAAVAAAIAGCGGSTKPLTAHQWYRGEAYCGHLKLAAFLRNGHLNPAQQAAVRETLGHNAPEGRRPRGPVDCSLYKFTITVTVGPNGSGAGIVGNAPPCSIPIRDFPPRNCRHP